MHTWVNKNWRHLLRDFKDSDEIIFIAKTSRPYTFSLFKLQKP